MGPDILPASDQAAATTDAIVDRAKHLGLTWGLRMATVDDGTVASAVLATYDGDDVSIGMVSMVGTLTAGARVYVLQVPPGGNFIISGSSPPGLGFIGANTTDNGTVATGTGTEQAVPSASWDNEPTYVFGVGRLYRAEVVGGAFSSAATAQAANIRVRKGTATITGTILGTWEHIAPAGFLGAAISFTYVTYIKNSTAAAVSTKLSLTIQRILGAANYSLYGDASVPLSVAVEDIGTIAANAALASIAVSV